MEEGACGQVAWQDTSHTEADPVGLGDTRWEEACQNSNVEVASFEDLEGSNAAAALEAEFVASSSLSQSTPQGQGPTSNLCHPAQSSEKPGVARGYDGRYSANLWFGHEACRMGISSRWHDRSGEVTWHQSSNL